MTEYERLKEVFRCYYVCNPDLSLLSQISCSTGLKELFRKVAWMSFLDILPQPITPTWGDIFQALRERYEYFLSNDYSSKFDELINQDVNRLYSDIPFFCRNDVRDIVTRICRVLAVQHKHIGYQQGIHELVGIVYYAFWFEPITPNQTDIPFPEEYESTFNNIINSDYIEHDTFIFVEQLLWFMSETFSLGNRGAKEQCIELFESLKKYNMKCYDHLNELGIIPTTFGIKWLRLLFSREFPIDENLWDAIFAHGKGLSLVKEIFLLLMMDCEKADDDVILSRLMQDPAHDFQSASSLARHAILFANNKKKMQ
ncbi:Rab GTPase activating protein [Entamoeba marina]